MRQPLQPPQRYRPTNRVITSTTRERFGNLIITLPLCSLQSGLC